MVSKYSSARIIQFFVFASLLFVLGGFLLAFSYFTYGFVTIAAGCAFMFGIWNFYTHSNKSISFLFDAVRSADSTIAFPVTNKNKSLDLLHVSLNNLNLHVQKVKLEAEVREQYYKAIIRQSSTGFIVMSTDFNIELINEAACILAGINPESSNLNIIKIKNHRLYDALSSLKAGENTTYKSYNKFSAQQLLLKASEIRTGSRDLILYSLQDIQQELNEKEIEAYQKLISILTHEIMNSLAPLSSISKTLNKIFEKETETFSPVELTTLKQGMKAIEEQSTGLTGFVSNYRKLIKIPYPVIKDINVLEWIDQLAILYNETCDDKNILFSIKHDGRMGLWEGDKSLLNQVMINLINNAIEALETCSHDKKLHVIFSQQHNHSLIQVGNNGPAIPPAIQEKIFVPFFTTKENGSGIGLSISSQIIKLHKGTLDVFSDEIAGTVFSITF